VLVVLTGRSKDDVHHKFFKCGCFRHSFTEKALQHHLGKQNTIIVPCVLKIKQQGKLVSNMTDGAFSTLPDISITSPYFHLLTKFAKLQLLQAEGFCNVSTKITPALFTGR